MLTLKVAFLLKLAEMIVLKVVVAKGTSYLTLSAPKSLMNTSSKCNSHAVPLGVCIGFEQGINLIKKLEWVTAFM